MAERPARLTCPAPRPGARHQVCGKWLPAWGDFRPLAAGEPDPPGAIEIRCERCGQTTMFAPTEALGTLREAV